MPKYWGKQIFAHGRFPEVGQKLKTEKKERKKERKLVITMAKLRMANASTHGARKPPGPIRRVELKMAKSRTGLPRVARTKSEKQGRNKIKFFYSSLVT